MIRLALLVLGLVFSMHAANAGPLSLQEFFRGRLAAKGSVENFRDGTHRDFTIAMAANWSGPIGTLVEDVVYADGERQHLVWSFKRASEGHFVGRREDVTRDATVVEDSEGISMSYKANTRLPSGITLNLSFEDRMTPVSTSVVKVQSDISYLFVSAARITMTVTRPPAR